MPSLTLLKTCVSLSFSGSTLLTPAPSRAAATRESDLAVLEARGGVEKPQRRGRWGLGFKAISSRSSFDSLKKKGTGSPIRLCCLKRMGRQVPGRETEAQDRNCLSDIHSHCVPQTFTAAVEEGRHGRPRPPLDQPTPGVACGGRGGSYRKVPCTALPAAIEFPPPLVLLLPPPTQGLLFCLETAQSINLRT